ncbi:MAG: transglycosylase SLT domain-containing protein [Thermovirgaceae bacterium]
MNRRERKAPVVVVLCLLLLLSFFVGAGFAEGDVYNRNLREDPVEAQKEPDPAKTRDGKMVVIMNRFMEANPELEEYAAGKFAGYVLEASDQFGVHPFLIAAIIIKESTVRYRARSRYAYGLMQINWSAHKRALRSAFSEIETLEDLIQPRNNILAGTYIFSCYLNSSDGNISEALAMYLGKNGTRYIKNVMENFELMLAQYEKKQEQRITSLPCLSLVAQTEA